MADQSNFDKLHEAGALNKDFPFTQLQRDVIESLSDREVDALISTKNKLAAVGLDPIRDQPDLGVF